MTNKEQQYKEMLELICKNLEFTMSKSIQKLQAKAIRDFLEEINNR